VPPIKSPWPAKVLGKPVYSPTAFSAALCLRRFGLRYIDKIKPEQQDYARDGDIAHERLYHHAIGHKTLEPLTDPHAHLASAALACWPDERIVWHPEVCIIADCGPFAIAGYADQFATIFVGDYKFTGDRKWIPGYAPGMKEPELARAAGEILRSDVQFIAYAAATAGEFRMINGFPYWVSTRGRRATRNMQALISGQWTYVIKPPKWKELQGNPHAIPVKFSATYEEIYRKFQTLERMGSLLGRVKEEFKSANEIAHNADRVCEGVGVGCDYSPFCKIHKPGKKVS